MSVLIYKISEKLTNLIYQDSLLQNDLFEHWFFVDPGIPRPIIIFNKIFATVIDWIESIELIWQIPTGADWFFILHLI